MRPTLALLACAALLSAPLHAATLHVEALGGAHSRGPADGHFELSSAVAAAADGDTIVVLPGTYELPVVVDGKSLTIVAAGDDALLVEPVIVRNLTARQSVVIDGLRLAPNLSGPGLTVEHCRGPVLLRDSTVSGPLVPAVPCAAVRVDCADALVLRRCVLRGSRAVGLEAGPALRLESGRVSLLDCDLQGGTGMVVGGSLQLAGGPGAEVLGGDLLVVGGSLCGGAGGDGRVPVGLSGGSAGGPGLLVSPGGQGAVVLVGVTPEGGAGGPAARRHPAGARGDQALAPPGRVRHLAANRTASRSAGARHTPGATLGRHL